MKEENNHRDTETPRRPERVESSYEHDPLTEQIIGAGIEVHRAVGPGLLEGVYEECMCEELTLRHISYRCQHEIPLEYKGRILSARLRIDLLVEGTVIVELKAVDKIIGLHEAQLLTYLKLTGLKTGLLINFNSPTLVQGVRRISL